MSKPSVKFKEFYNQEKQGVQMLPAKISFSLPFNLIFLFFLSILPFQAEAQESEDYFRQNCVSCHTIGGGRLTGPDLKNVEKRQEREWLVQFIIDPKSVIDSGDSYAAQLLEESRGVVMPAVMGLTKDRAEALLNLIAHESSLPKSKFAGVQLSNRPFTAKDVEKGSKLFLGETRLKNGGGACISCHSVGNLGVLGGGKWGPDLTKVYERLEGRKTLGNWLSAPATPIMGSIFKDHAMETDEILSFLALFEDAAKRKQSDYSSKSLNFVLISMFGTILILFLFDWAWRNRFRTVRRFLVNS